MMTGNLIDFFAEVSDSRIEMRSLGKLNSGMGSRFAESLEKFQYDGEAREENTIVGMIRAH